MTKISPLNRYILLIVVILGLWAIGLEQAGAAEARVYLRNRLVPLYIQNIEFHYAREYGSRQTAIFFIKEQRKYISFGFDRIRSMRILGIEGYRSGSPVFKLDLWLNEPGHGMVVQLIPLKMITGLNSGVPWKYKLNALSGYDDNARQIKKIEFIQPQKF